MKTIVVLFALAAIATAAPAFHEDGFGDFENILHKVPEKRENKSPEPEIHEAQDSSVIEIPATLPAVHSITPDMARGLLKKKILIKKPKGHHHLNRDSDGEKAESQEDCMKPVKDKCEATTATLKTDTKTSTECHEYQMPENKMGHSFKIAKEAFDNLERDLEKIEHSPNTKTAHWKHADSQSQTEMHENIELARQAIEHLQKNFANLDSVNLHAATIKGAEIDDRDFHGMKAEGERMFQWKQAVQNNAELARNIEDSFRFPPQTTDMLTEKRNSSPVAMKQDMETTNESHKRISDIQLGNDDAKKHELEDHVNTHKHLEKLRDITMKNSNAEKEKQTVEMETSATEMKSESFMLEKPLKTEAVMTHHENQPIKKSDEFIGEPTSAKTVEDLQQHLQNSELLSKHDEHETIKEDGKGMNNEKTMEVTENIENLKNGEVSNTMKSEDTHNHQLNEHKEENRNSIDNMKLKSHPANTEIHKSGDSFDSHSKSSMTELNDVLAKSESLDKPTEQTHSHIKSHEEKEIILESPNLVNQQARHHQENTLDSVTTHHMGVTHSDLSKKSAIEPTILEEEIKHPTDHATHQAQKMNFVSSQNEHAKYAMEKEVQPHTMQHEFHDSSDLHRGQASNMHLQKAAAEHFMNFHGTEEMNNQFASPLSRNNFDVVNHHPLSFASPAVRTHENIMMHGNSIDSSMQQNMHMGMRQPIARSDFENNGMMKWAQPHESARGAYGGGSSGLNVEGGSSGAGSGSSSSSGAVGIFPNANVGNCAIPLLLRCSPSVISGSLAKPHAPSYGAPASAYREDFSYLRKRDTKKVPDLLNMKTKRGTTDLKKKPTDAAIMKKQQ